ncbi:VOC family protein [Curtobacterium pusillum]|uniref:VOC family protein n=1 Tax=Curtobacterium pusillum TaxID=69373 RepID=UPI0011AA4348|nr:VOC family protein [Curtobacterium pusillum]
MTDQTPRTYPEGVPSWIEARHPDPDAAQEFYRGLFGWAFEERVPPGAPGSYRIASIDGRDVGAIASSEDPAAWTTYIAVDDAVAAAERIVGLGGTAGPPEDAGPGGAAGRSVDCVDPRGAAFGLWQARARLGAQHINAPGGWVFSDLRSTAPEQAFGFYEQLFGWQVSGMQEGPSAMVRLPGYGDHLAATSDPDIRERQVGAPEGFADVIGALARIDAGPDDWHVSFSVADRDDAAALAERLGGRVLGTWQGYWTRAAELQDPQGATFRVTQFAPDAG